MGILITPGRHRAVAMSLSVALAVAACAPPYKPKVVEIIPPDRAPESTQIPGTDIKVSALFYNTRDSLRRLFPENAKWLWDSHIVLAQLTFASQDAHPTQVLLDSGYADIAGKFYPIISPHEVFDMAWAAGNPLAKIEDEAYNASVLAFAFLTLGLGSVVWVLPSPFQQPAPDATPFSRDINYKSLSGNFTLQPGSLRTGLVYVAVPESLDIGKLTKAVLVLDLVTETPAASVPHEIRISLPEAGQPAAS